MIARQYGVRGPDPRNTVVEAEDRRAAEQMRFPEDVIVVRELDESGCWGEWKVVEL